MRFHANTTGLRHLVVFLQSVRLLQFFFVLFVLLWFHIWRLCCVYLFHSSSSFSCLGRAVLRDCCISWLSSLIFYSVKHCRIKYVGQIVATLNTLSYDKKVPKTEKVFIVVLNTLNTRLVKSIIYTKNVVFASVLMQNFLYLISVNFI